MSDMNTPWQVRESSNAIELALQIYDANNTNLCEFWRRGDMDGEMRKARLMAAAPDLLEALEEIVSLAEYYAMPKGDKSPWSYLEKARAVIAKARGQQ